MTAISIWLELDAIWAASDSRVGSSTDVFTDEAAKILPLRAKYLHAPRGPFVDSGISDDYGFAYTGRVELCLLVYGALANVASHIGVLPPSNRRPSLADIAALAEPIFTKYTRDYTASARAKNPRAAFPLSKIVLFGWCPRTDAPVAVELTNSDVGGGKVNRRVLSLATPYWAGSGAALLDSRWKATGPTYESPLRTLEAVVSGKLKASVGGSSQITICDRTGYRVVATKFMSQIPGTAEYLGFLVASELDPQLDGETFIAISQEA